MDINWQWLIAGAVTVFVITYLTKRASFAVKEAQLKFGIFIKGLGLFCLLLSVTPLVVLITGNYQVGEPGEAAALIGLTSFFGVGAIYFLAEGFFVTGSYDEESISFTTPWTGKKVEKWDDLESLNFNGFAYWYVLKFKSGKKIRLSSYLGGHGYLVEYLWKRGHNF